MILIKYQKENLYFWILKEYIKNQNGNYNNKKSI